MGVYICFGEKRSLISEVPFILSICKTKHFFTWCWVFFFVLAELRNSHAAEGSRVQTAGRALQYLSTPFWLLHSSLQIHSPIFTSSSSHWGFHILLQLQAASSSSPCLLDCSLVLLPLHHGEKGDRLNITCLW